jgi:thymidine kinase
MASGKTSRLIGVAHEPSKQRGGVVFIQPPKSSRTHGGQVQSRIFALYAGAVTARRPRDFVRLLGSSQNLFLEEIQFWERSAETAAEFKAVIIRLLAEGKTIYWSGLPIDFRAEPFMVVAWMMAMSEHLELLQVECVVCQHKPAHFPQRLIFGHPAPRHHPRFVPDTPAFNRQGLTYETRCGDCYQLPDQPNQHLRAIWESARRRSTSPRPRR